MRYVTIKKTLNSGLYLPKEYSDESLHLLALFLHSDANSFINDIIEFLENPKDRYGSGNSCDLRKIANNIVLTLQPLKYDPGYDDPDFIPELRFQTTIPEFIKLLKQWDVAICTMPQPQELLIIQDDSGKLNLDIKKINLYYI